MIKNPNPTTKQEWVDIALKNNYRLQASVLRRDASQDSARSSASEHLPKINIVGTESESNTNQYSCRFDANYDFMYKLNIDNFQNIKVYKKNKKKNSWIKIDG